MLPTAAFLVGLGLACPATLAYNFQPDNHATWRNTRVPSLVDLSEDQNSGSYWSSAFVTATLEYWKNVDNCVVDNTTKTVTSDSLSIKFTNFFFRSAAPDKISELQLGAKSSDYSFDLTIKAKTSKIVLNGGNGVIPWGPGYANSTHWSIPAGRTSGTLKLGRKKPLRLDESRSFTWYDHQIIAGAPDNFTFFEVHFPNPDIRVSLWAYDWPDSLDEWRFATVRVDKEAMLVLPYNLAANWDNTWTSPVSNKTFPLSWTVTFDNGDYLELESVRDDQEIQNGAWTGFVNVKSGRFLGQSSGFGVGDAVYLK